MSISDSTGPLGHIIYPQGVELSFFVRGRRTEHVLDTDRACSGADRACSWYRTRFRMWRYLVQDAEGMGTVAVPGSLPDGCDKAGHGRLDLVGDGLES